MGQRSAWWRAIALGGLGALAALTPHAATAQAPDAGAVEAAPVSPGDPNAHLRRILDRSTPPTYRRFGSPGMAAAAADAAAALEGAGYSVVRHDRRSSAWVVDYAPGREPLLERVADGRAFPTESAVELRVPTPPEGVTCVVRPVDQVGAGECGFIPYEVLSPEWTNLTADLGGALRTIEARGGVGAVLQGDLEHAALIALRATGTIPAVVSLVTADDVLGRTVRMRALGHEAPATLHNVVGIRPPADPTLGYVLLQGHLDGWFAAAADNGGGAAAVLAAAERLAGDVGRGLLVALYDGEEWGLRGSKALAEDLAGPAGLVAGGCGPVVRLHDVVAVVNLDAPSAPASDLLGAIPPPLDTVANLVSYRVLVFSEEPNVAALLTTTALANGVLGLPIPVAVANPLNGGVARTDVKWFHEAGIPAAWTVVGYPEYHTTADTLDVVDPADLERVTAAAVDLVRALSAAAVGRLPGSTLPAPGSTPPPPCGDPPAASLEGPAATVAAGRLPATGRDDPIALAGVLALAGLAGLRLSRRRAAGRAR